MMKQKHMPFNADAQSKKDYKLEVIGCNGKMVICGKEGVVYITKEQAMEFWDIQEKATEFLDIKEKLPTNSLTQYGNCLNVMRQFGDRQTKSCLQCGLGPCKTGTIGDL